MNILQVLSAWLLDQASLGHRAPRRGHPRMKWCPACSRVDINARLSSLHVWGECVAMEDVREEVYKLMAVLINQMKIIHVVITKYGVIFMKIMV